MTTGNEHKSALKGEICKVNHNKIDAFVKEHSEEIGFLVTHFKEVGIPYKTVQDLLVDMLHDVIDVWVDSHRKNDSCLEDFPVYEQDRLERELEEQEQGEVSEETMRNAPPVDSYRVVSDTGE